MNRDASLCRAMTEIGAWDVVVIGGGATGLGAAVDAASRGYRTLLVEQSDFAKATSSRSTKLAHGGVRYLQQGNLSLVLEALKERGRMLRNAPHLVRRQSFVIPAYAKWQVPFYGVGLKAYDALSGSRALVRPECWGPKRFEKCCRQSYQTALLEAWNTSMVSSMMLDIAWRLHRRWSRLAASRSTTRR